MVKLMAMVMDGERNGHDEHNDGRGCDDCVGDAYLIVTTCSVGFGAVVQKWVMTP